MLSIAAFFVVMTVTFSLITDTFLTQTNLLNILRQIAPLMIVAVAMTFVITTAGIDLSVGSVLALVNALAAISLQAGLYWPLVLALMLGVGVVIGLFQGFFIAYEGIPAFIVTLAGLSSIRGQRFFDKGLFNPDRSSEPLQRDRARLDLRSAHAGDHRCRRAGAGLYRLQ